MILITGGCGYIGSHIVVELLLNNYEVIIIDNLSNSSIKTIEQIEKITNKKVHKFYEGDILDKDLLDLIFKSNKIDKVIHLAGMKSVDESFLRTEEYYDVNVLGTIYILETMKKYKCNHLLFSSSATVYKPKPSKAFEEDELKTSNPYGHTKLMCEKIFLNEENIDITCFRYFNPVGAHESGEIGENPKNLPANLVPYITKVAAGVLPFVNVFGDDYDTKDGTGVRDYIHVMDIANAHIKSFDLKGVNIINLGSSNGFSVLEIIKEFEKILEKDIPYKLVGRRNGDIPFSVASNEKAFELLGWKPFRSLHKMCLDSLNWQLKYPNGF
jgi:UDP-glucose 4-epimerase